MKEVTVEIIRPVNPAGMSFVKYVWGGVAAKNRIVIEKYKRELGKIVQKLGFAIEDKIGSDKLITGTITIILDDNNKPIEAKAVNLKIWEATKDLKEEISVKL